MSFQLSELSDSQSSFPFPLFWLVGWLVWLFLFCFDFVCLFVLGFSGFFFQKTNLAEEFNKYIFLKQRPV